MLHQELMNQAHDIWNKKIDKGELGELLIRLNFHQKVAFLTGKLNYQVENGGFSQWICNDYSKNSDQLLIVLGLINTEASKKVSNMVLDILSISKGSHSDGHDEFNGAMDSYSTSYYKISNQFMKDVEDFLYKEIGLGVK